MPSYDVLSGSATLGRITAIRQPGGVVISSPQSTTDIHYTKAQVDAMVAPLQAQLAVMSFQIAALQSAALKVRINGVLQPCSRLSFDSTNLSTMYTASVDHCHVWVSGDAGTPVDSPN